MYRSSLLFTLISLMVLAVFFAASTAAFAQDLDPDTVGEALRDAEAGHNLQLDLPGVDSPVRGASAPQQRDRPQSDADFSWLADMLGTLGTVLFWGLVIGLVGLIIYYLVREAPFIQDWLARRRKKADQETEGAAGAASAPVSPEFARSLLADADKLAARGDYAAAVRLLLFRSVEDIARRLGRGVPKALTSREILADAPLGQTSREAFDDIVSAVELSYFGERFFGADDFQRCRASYERFALGGETA